MSREYLVGLFDGRFGIPFNQAATPGPKLPGHFTELGLESFVLRRGVQPDPVVIPDQGLFGPA